MAFNDTTLGRASRTVLYELVDRPARTGAARINVAVLLPYSLLEVDGTVYVETNSAYSMLEGGGAHTIPTYGNLGDTQWTSRSLGLRSADVSQGTTRAQPSFSQIHQQGWI